MTPVGLAALWGLLALGGPSYVQDPSPAEPGPASELEQAAPDSTLDPGSVPFVAQEPLLCGGASAVMVERYWGRRAVYADAYAHLVLEDEGGIRVSDLLSAMESRGLEVRVSTDEPGQALSALSRGVPPIVLLTGGEPALHYVVLVGADEERMWFHDPNFGPSRTLPRNRFMERWAGSGHLALLATPGDGADRASASPSPRDPVAATPSPPATPPVLDSAVAALRVGDHARARAFARHVLDDPRGPGDLARRVLATSFYLDGRPFEALTAWNALSEPVVDLVEIRGATRVRHHVMASDLGVEAGSLLTASGLRVARRRLAAIPAVATHRVDYAPLPDGTVEVRAFVTEEPRWPSPLSLVGEAVSAGVDREASVELGPFLPSGDRWTLGGAWRASQAWAHGSFATASRQLPGVAAVSVEWRREHHSATAPAPTEERTRATLRLDRWVSASVRVGGGAALERWRAGAPGGGAGGGPRRVGSVLARVTWSPATWLEAAASGESWWGRGADYRRGSVQLHLAAAVDGGWELRSTLGATTASRGAPRTVWPGAGTGEIREGLLRGHPLQVDGRIAGPGLGRRLLHGTVELRRFRRLGPLRAGLGIFLDGARAWPGEASSPPRTLFDPGAGLFVDTGGRELRIDVARGDEAWVVSGRVSPSR